MSGYLGPGAPGGTPRWARAAAARVSGHPGCPATRLGPAPGVCGGSEGEWAPGHLERPATEAITPSLPRERQGVASALNDVTREFGTALGVALFGAVLSAGYRDAIDERLGGIPDPAAGPAREGIANAIAAADGAGSQAAALVRAAQDSFVEGWQRSMWAGVGVMVLLFAFVVARGPMTGRRVDRE